MTTETSPLAGHGATSSAPESATVSVRALIDEYMSQYAGRDPTRASQLARWCLELGERPAESITDDDVFHVLERLRKEPARVYHGKDADGRPVHRTKPGHRHPATVNRYQAALAAVFTWAIKRRRVRRGWENPCRKVERAQEQNAVVRFLAQDECARLLAAARESTWPRLYLIVLMALTTGARRGELLGLTWGDLDLERAIAHVQTTKNGQPRALPLLPGVVEELRRFQTQRLETRVFPGRGSLSKPRHFESAWAAALDRAQIRRFRFHDLRHTCASYLAQNGASLLEIADVMGHRQLAMVKRYAHLTTDTKAKLVNRVLGGIK